jgi:hypothetical protein
MGHVTIQAAGVRRENFHPPARQPHQLLAHACGPKQQAEAFRQEHSKVCAHAKSMAFQGTGNDIFTTSCEIELTETLLKQFGP